MTLIHPSAEIDKTARIGDDSKIWHHVQIRENAILGRNCIVGKGVYIDHHVIIGDNCKIQNYASIYFPAVIENSVFIGPYVCLTNDKQPRATGSGGRLKQKEDWQTQKILIKEGSSVGAGSVVLPGAVIGKRAMIGAASLISKNVPDYGLVFGNPAKLQGFVCRCGFTLIKKKSSLSFCPNCNLKAKS